MDFSYSPAYVEAGNHVVCTVTSEKNKEGEYSIKITLDDKPVKLENGAESIEFKLTEGDNEQFHVRLLKPGSYKVNAAGPVGEDLKGQARKNALAKYQPIDTIEAHVPTVYDVALVPQESPSSDHEDLWAFIGKVSENLRFNNFMEFLRQNPHGRKCDPEYGAVSYETVHNLATEFVTNGALGQQYERPDWIYEATRAEAIKKSYVSDRKKDLAKPFPIILEPECYPLEQVPFVELIFNYWMEEAMLYQTLNHIVARFQNRRPADGRIPLERFSANPLMPLRGLLYGLADAERDRLTVRRRSAEYQYEYGLQLIGKAIPSRDQVVEKRTQFLDAFHSLLHATFRYYKERDDKTITADPFPLLSSLQELHLVLARGAHNQFADLPLTARIETLDVQWMLAQPEMREFLGGPTMIPYEEVWMDRVDTMKSIQNWSDVSVTHFYDLAVHGEQLLLSVRHGRWNESTRSSDDAENWAMKWRNSIQRYIHAYRVVTGSDLSERMDATMPSRLLAQRLLARTGRV